ncbi:hypothetical protein DFH08DRAFT_976247 [Mycena albidolilacea]|uniref:Uncharacterized protein n=1 Tax=Mycena albidolilacea TaxID=1033008 RepID=A0AAD6Z395_9AGAR|nr:hypothetical protein DFH08DRAFT_976247 [Mycena albidolilacea]
MAHQAVPSALDSAGTAFISVLAAYEGVAKVEQLPVAVKHATLQTAIDRAHGFVLFKESLTHDNRSAVKDSLYTLCNIVTTVTREQKFQAPKSHMAGISAMITFYETQIEANAVKRADRPGIGAPGHLFKSARVATYYNVLHYITTSSHKS